MAANSPLPIAPPEQESEPDNLEVEVNLRQEIKRTPSPAGEITPQDIEIIGQRRTASAPAAGATGGQTAPGQLSYRPLAGGEQTQTSRPSATSAQAPGLSTTMPRAGPMASSTPLPKAASGPSSGGRPTETATPLPQASKGPRSEGHPTETTTPLPERQLSAIPSRPSPQDIRRMEQGITGTSTPAGQSRGLPGSQTSTGRPSFSTQQPKKYVPSDNPATSSRTGIVEEPGSALPEEKLPGATSAKEPEPVDVEKNKSPYDEPGNVPEKNDEAAPGEVENPGEEAPGAKGQPKKGKVDEAPDRDKLADDEKTGGRAKTDKSGAPESEKLARGYRPSSDADAVSRFRLRNLFNTRRKKLVGGGVAGGVIGFFMFFSVVQGPLQFIHMAQLLLQFHHSSNENAGNSRLFKFYRFAKSDFDPRVTRVGLIGHSIASKLDADMKASGIITTFSPQFKYFNGFIVDSQEGSFAGKTPEEIKQSLIASGVPEEAIVTDPSQLTNASAEQIDALGKGHVVVSADKMKAIAKYKLGKLAIRLSGKSKITAAINGRSFARWAGFDLHPINLLDRSRNQTLADLFKKLQAKTYDRLKNGTTSIDTQVPPKKTLTGKETPEEKAAIEAYNAEVDKLQEAADSAKLTIKDSGGVIDAERAGASFEGTKFQEFKTKYAAKLRGAAGVMGAIGVVCVVKNINDKMYEIRYVQVLLPTMRMGARSLALGSQAMTGQDLDTDQAGFYKQRLDDQKGQSWITAAPIQANLGQKPDPNTDVNQNIKDSFSDKRPFDEFLGKIPGLNGVCSPLGQITLGVVGLVLSFFTGGGYAAIMNGLVLAMAINGIEPIIAHWLAGNVVNLNAAGPELGGLADYGVRMLSSGEAQSAGGRVLTDAESSQNQVETIADNQTNWQSQSLAHRLFSPVDARSALSRFMDKNVSSSPMQNLSKMGNGLVSGVIRSMASLPRLIDGTVQAANTTTSGYQYPFPEIGFSLDELQNDKTENPFANAKRATEILTAKPEWLGPTGKVAQCFGALITHDADGNNWKVSHNDPSLSTSDVKYNPYAPDYRKLGCDDNSPDWLSVRMFIFDDLTAISVACYEGDLPSCLELGFSSAAAGSAGASSYLPNALPNLALGDL